MVPSSPSPEVPPTAPSAALAGGPTVGGDVASETGTAILDAALEETTAHGIRRTSLSDIARRSGVSRQTIYRYWPDAQALFASLVTREVVAQLPTQTRAASIDELVTMLVDSADRVRALPIVERLRTTDPELFARYVLERLGTSQRHVHAFLAEQVRVGQQGGFVRVGDPERSAAMLLLVLQSAVQSAPLVAEWLDADGWRTELGAAVRGILEVRS